MLLTSGQVSLAISSTIVFFFTTALFLCGYVVQQKTVNDIREAIKPQPRPVHTNLYVPPSPNATPDAVPLGEDGAQIVEITNEEPNIQVAEDQSTDPVSPQQEIEPNEEDGLVQGADGGFLRKQTQRRKKQKTLLDDPLAVDSRRSVAEGASNPGKSAYASRSSTTTSGEKLSRAARRKLIKDEFVKLAGEELLKNPNIYRKRRLW